MGIVSNCSIQLRCPTCGFRNDYETVVGLENLCECASCKVLFEVIITIRPIPDAPFYREIDWLTENYIERDRTIADIAGEFGVRPMTIHHWLRRHDIPTRTRGRRAFE